MSIKKIRIGTRKSALALWQSRYVGECLKEIIPNCEIELVEMNTKGDENLKMSLSKIGDKGLFTQELEDALLSERIDIAVHSLKDMPTTLPEGLALTAFTKRHDPRDAFLSKHGDTIESLPKGAIVGTSSLRRKALILAKRPDVRIKDIRGNVQTRIRKYQEEDYDAVIMAVAGLERMGLDEHITAKLDPLEFIPSAGQGVVTVESTLRNKELLDKLQELTDHDAKDAVLAERSFLRQLEGGCQVPMGAYGYIENDQLCLIGFVASVDGRQYIEKQIKGPRTEAEALGVQLAQEIYDDGGKAVLSDFFENEV